MVKVKIYNTILIALAVTRPVWVTAQATEQCLYNSDMLEIANIQGCYLHMLNSNDLNLVPELFASNDNITLLLPDKPTGISLRGLENITGSTSTYRTRIASDRSIAEGSWMSIGFTVLGPAFCNQDPPYQSLPVVGRYAHDFVNEGGIWKIQHFTWAIFQVVSLPIFNFDPATAGPGWANTPMVPGNKTTSWPLDPYDV